jgi:hypothetical protein
MVTTSFVTLLRQPGGKLGCRLSADNTVSEVHAGGAAAAAGLKAGWLVKSINDKPVAVLEELIKQSVFKFVFEVDKDPQMTEEPAAGKKRKLQAEPKKEAKKEAKKVAKKVAKLPKPVAAAARKAPQRYVYLVWHEQDSVGYYHGDGSHTATVCGVYDNEAAAQAHADDLGGESDNEDYDGRIGGESRSYASVVCAPIFASFADYDGRDVCSYEAEP